MDAMAIHEILEQYQQLLNKIPGILSSKIISGDGNAISEIHILADMHRGPKQISRDIQSALLARYNQPVDHKIISIAQIDEGTFMDSSFRLSISSIQLSTQPGRIEAKVVLAKEDQTFEGVALGGNSIKGRCRVIAEATLNAVHQFLNRYYIFVLYDTIQFAIGDRSAVATAVFHFGEAGEECLSGSSIIKNDENEAVVRATLDAINRRLMQYSQKQGANLR